jgi:polar amino acid transport system permease protein
MDGYSGILLDLVVRYGPRLLQGLVVTLELVGTSLLLGGLLAIPVAMGRLSRNPLVRLPAFAYVFFFRGTPLLAQVYLIYYGSGQFRPLFEQMGLWWFFREAWYCAVLAFTLNTAAYTGEIIRGGIQGVPAGEIEAARACGMSGFKLYRRIILPTAYRIALPAYGNEIILMVKASSIASIITIFDLMGETKLAFSRSFRLEVYLIAAAFYLVLTLTFERLWAALERWLNPQREVPRQIASKVDPLKPRADTAGI